MKLLAAVLAIPAFALVFSATSYPGPTFLLIMLLGVIGVAWRGRMIARGVDEFCNPSPRRRRVFPFVALLLIAGGCRQVAPPRAPEPVVALAEVETLDCGGRSCAVTEVAGATLITVSE